MPRPGRRTFDTGLDFFEKLQKITGKDAPNDVLHELRRGYSKWRDGIGETEKGSGSVIRQVVEGGETKAGPHSLPVSQVDEREDPVLGGVQQGEIVPQSMILSAHPIGEPARDPGETDLVSASEVPIRRSELMTTPASGPERHGSISPEDREYRQLRNQLIREKIETERARRISATSTALKETIQCPHCRLMLLKEQAFEHIRGHNSNDQLLPAEDRSVRIGKAYCFKHGVWEPPNSVCFPVDRGQVLEELAGVKPHYVQWNK